MIMPFLILQVKCKISGPFIQLLIILSIMSTIGCINLKDVEEGPCPVVRVDPTFDLLWITNYAEWYNPIISRHSIYKWVVALTGLDEKDVSEDMVNRSCPILYVGGIYGSIHTGFRGTRKITIDPYTADHGIFEWTQKKQDGSAGYRGRSYISLTDNDKYYVAITCWENQNIWGYTAISNVRTLDEESKNTIRNHVKSLGFDVENNWLEIQYDDCIDLSNPQEYIKTTTIAPQKSAILLTDFVNSIPTNVSQTIKSNNSMQTNVVNSSHKNPNFQAKIIYDKNLSYQLNSNSNPIFPYYRNYRRSLNNPNYISNANNLNVNPNYHSGISANVLSTPSRPGTVGSSNSVQSSSNIPKGLANPPANRNTPASEYFFDTFRTMVNYFQKLYGDVMKNVLRVAVRVISRMGLGSILL